LNIEERNVWLEQKGKTNKENLIFFSTCDASIYVVSTNFLNLEIDSIKPELQ
jgi:hypothetical protein